MVKSLQDYLSSAFLNPQLLNFLFRLPSPITTCSITLLQNDIRKGGNSWWSPTRSSFFSGESLIYGPVFPQPRMLLLWTHVDGAPQYMHAYVRDAAMIMCLARPGARGNTWIDPGRRVLPLFNDHPNLTFFFLLRGHACYFQNILISC